MRDRAVQLAAYGLFSLGVFGLCSSPKEWVAPGLTPQLLATLTGAGPGRASVTKADCDEWMSLELDLATNDDCVSGRAAPNTPCVTCEDLNSEVEGDYPSDTEVQTYGWNSPQVLATCGDMIQGVCVAGACLGTNAGLCQDLKRYTQQVGSPGGP